MNSQEEHHIIPDRIYLSVWLGLVLLTVITVGVSYLDMKKFTVFTAMLIATVKASLVLLYFMHIRFEKKMFAIMVFVVMAVFAVFIVLTFSDYPFRV